VCDCEDIFNSFLVNFPPGFVPAWSCGGRHFGFECVSPLHRSIFYRSLSPASLAIVSSSFEFIDVIFPHFFFAFSCIYCPLNSHPISFLKRAHMLRARHSFFHRQRSAHLFHFRPFIFTFTSFIFFCFFFRPSVGYPTFPSISFSTFPFRHFVFTFQYFIFLFSLAHQSYTPRRTSHSFSFNSFIQPRSNTSFNSLHFVHSIQFA
jgi:hypothetical protein